MILSFLLFLTFSQARIRKTMDLDMYYRHSRSMRPSDSSSNSSYLYYEQKLDHFNTSDNRTFQQRYVFEDKYYTNSHMMFVYISGESQMSTQAISNKWVAGLNPFVLIPLTAKLLFLSHYHYTYVFSFRFD